MKKMIAAIIVAFPLSATSVFAADPPATPQQSKMAACSKANKGLKGDEFKTAQKECLSKAAVPTTVTAAADSPVNQKGKMAACSKQNKGMKGEEFKQAQKECLSK